MIFDNNYDYILNNNNNGYNNICYDITKTQIIQTQIQINNNLAAKLRYLNTQAATATLQETSTAIAGVASQVMEEINGENPFANKFSATDKKTGYLFIKAA